MSGRATGNDAGRFAIVPPGWDAELPDGLTAIQASTNVLSIVGRFACTGPADIPAVNALQDAVVLEPLDPDAPRAAGLPAVAEVSDGPVAIFCVGTGVRPEEAFGADWSDVDLAAGVFTIRKAYAKGKLRPTPRPSAPAGVSRSGRR